MNAYEREVMAALKVEFDAGQIRISAHADEVFSTLSNVYPSFGSKIDWERVPNSIQWAEYDQSLQPGRFAEFFDEMRSRFELEGTVLYAGDSVTEFALESTVEGFRRALPKLIEVPQHHYFVGSNCSWCMCLTMEGDMGFGRVTLPSSPR